MNKVTLTIEDQEMLKQAFIAGGKSFADFIDNTLDENGCMEYSASEQIEFWEDLVKGVTKMYGDGLSN